MTYFFACLYLSADCLTFAADISPPETDGRVAELECVLLSAFCSRYCFFCPFLRLFKVMHKYLPPDFQPTMRSTKNGLTLLKSRAQSEPSLRADSHFELSVNHDVLFPPAAEKMLIQRKP